MVRYCDDAVFTFENSERAAQFMLLLKERLKRFDIELNEKKTQIMQNGRKYTTYCANSNKKRPMFTFLGFRHYWMKSLNRKLGIMFWRPAVMTCPKRGRETMSVL